MEQKIYEYSLTSNPKIPEYQDLAFCSGIPTKVDSFHEKKPAVKNLTLRSLEMMDGSDL
jgi:hypothetical protein